MNIPILTINSSRTRLMLTYLGVIMALSIGFSAVFYAQSVNEAKSNLAAQQFWLRDSLYFITPDRLQRGREAQLGEFKINLLRKLTVLNIGMLGIGTGASYILAKRSLRPLEEAFTAQGRFTSDAAHELRTPLTAMKAETEVALRSKKLSLKDAREVLRSNLEEIAKLETLTSALLRLARRDEQIDTSYWQDYKLIDIIVAASDRLKDKAKRRNIDIKLPKSSVVVHGDPEQLTELFVTIIGNAIKYSHDGKVVEIKISKADKIRIDIIDSGVGIAEVDMPHIFERFYRADTSRSREGAEGYGLGLSLAQAIVSAHGGEIKVKSKYGEGSTFSIILPLT